MKKLVALLACALMGVVNMSAASPEDAAKDASSSFTVTRDTQVPGEVLKPGQYVIHVVDHLDDRFITRIDDAEGKHPLIFLSVPATAADSAAAPGVSTWASGPNHLPAFRGFSFSSGLAIEFVYPKEDAAELAKLNRHDVVAVDYAGSNLKSLTGVSNEEMKEVNLWLLSLTRTGVKDETPAILAKRYVAPAPAEAPQTQVASVPVVPPTQASAPTVQPTQVAAVDNVPVPPVAQPRVRPARAIKPVAELPHTGSELPLVWLMGVLAFVLAFALHGVRAGWQRS